MPIKLNGATSGSVELDVPAAVGSDISFTLPSADGNTGQFLQTNGSGSLSLQTATQIDTSVAAITYTPGTSTIIFDNIPSTVSQITFAFESISCTAGGLFSQRLGTSSGYALSGYLGSSYYNHGGSSTYVNQLSDGFKSGTSSATHVYHGQCVLKKINLNYWSSVCTMSFSDMPLMTGWAGSLNLGGALTRVLWAWHSGNFDGGTIKMDMEHDS